MHVAQHISTISAPLKLVSGFRAGTATPIMSLASIYAKQLLSRGYGLPLWRPEPTKFGEVHMGDVGFVEDGHFYRLFNVTRSRDHPLNKWGVPDDFVMLKVDEDLHHHTEEQYLPPGPICTTSTTWDKVEVEAVGTAPQAGIGLSYKFTCKGDRGAIAVLRDDAKQERYVRSRACRDYICAHHASWEAFARRLGWYVHASELVLVYGCVKTSSWALAAYASRENEHEMGFSLTAGSFVSMRAGVEARDHVRMSMEQRSGPQRPDDADSSTPAAKDQCLFISYYKIKRRGMGTVKLQLDAALEDVSDIPGSEYFCLPWTCFPLDIFYKYRSKRKNTAAKSSVGHAGLDVEGLERRETTMDPVDAVLDYILEQSGDADIAVVSHDDVYGIFADADWPDDVAARLRETRPNIVSDHAFGPAFIACDKPLSSSSPSLSPALPEGRRLSSSSVHSRKPRSPIRQSSLRPRFLNGGSPRTAQNDRTSSQFGSTHSISSRRSRFSPNNSFEAASFYTAQSHDNSPITLPNPPDWSPPHSLSPPGDSPLHGTPPQLPSVLEEETRLAYVQTGSLERFSNLRLRQLGIPTNPLEVTTPASSLPHPSESSDGMLQYRFTRMSSFRRSLTNLFSRVPACGSPAGFDQLAIGNG